MTGCACSGLQLRQDHYGGSIRAVEFFVHRYSGFRIFLIIDVVVLSFGRVPGMRRGMAGNRCVDRYSRRGDRQHCTGFRR